ncbi:hypothetical protein KFK09_005758 [Dendrobium nobile]|uniref:Uncharacterized protein n=1 Tax=Dendrobium nobile TaxID=94219 RepID=A0A8T3C1G1_DENNO|nr:hypothetical protein KFK09_005758 [Dendrobium nobile]
MDGWDELGELLDEFHLSKEWLGADGKGHGKDMPCGKGFWSPFVHGSNGGHLISIQGLRLNAGRF